LGCVIFVLKILFLYINAHYVWKKKRKKKVRSREMKLISLSLSMVFSKILHSLTIIKNKNELAFFFWVLKKIEVFLCYSTRTKNFFSVVLMRSRRNKKKIIIILSMILHEARKSPTSVYIIA
jgi:hypothetical protein